MESMEHGAFPIVPISPLRMIVCALVAKNQPCHGMWSWVEGIPNLIVAAPMLTATAERAIRKITRCDDSQTEVQIDYKSVVRGPDQADKDTATSDQLKSRSAGGRPGRRPSVMRSSHDVLGLGWGK